MKACDLQFALQSEFRYRRIADLQKIVVLEKIVEYPGMNEQRRFAVRGIRRMQCGQFRAQFLQQSRRGSLLADLIAHPIGAVRSFRERTQVEADDGFLQPAAGARNDFVGIDAQLPKESSPKRL